MAVTIKKCALRFSLDAIQTKDSVDLSNPTDTLLQIFSQAFNDGSGDDQITGFWHDRRTLAPSGIDDLNLTGSLINAFGEALTFTSIKFMIFKNQSALVTAGHPTATTATITFAPTVTNEFVAFTIPCEVGGLLPLIFPKSGLAVTASTADILRIVNADGSNQCQYDITLGGLI